MISHWDDARTWRGERGHIAGTWTSLTGRASRTVGAKRIQVDPGMWSTPLHLEGAEEEIFYVLGGSGVSVQWEGEGDPVGYEVRAGDCLVHLALENAHTLQAGPDGLDVLAFGQRTSRRHHVAPAGRVWRGSARRGRPSAPRRITRGRARPPPARREVGELSPRPANIVERRRDRGSSSGDMATIGRRVSMLGDGRRLAADGPSHCEVLPGMLSVPPHCHSLEEEIFVVLEGDGHLLLWEEDGVEEHEVRAGSVVAAAAGHGRLPRVPRRRRGHDAPHVRAA